MARTLKDWLEDLEDVDDTTREEAAKALAELADRQAKEALSVALEDDYWAVRSHAGWGLTKIDGAQALDSLLLLFNDPMMEVRDEAVEAAASLGSDVVERLIASLKDERWRVREQAAKALGKIRDPRAVDQLIVACRDRDGAVKSAAAEALGRIGHEKAVPALIKLFKDTSKTVRETAGTALVSIGQPAVQALVDCLKDPYFVVRCHGARALGGMTTDYQIGRSWVRDPQVVDALLDALKDPDRAVREDATIALGHIGDPHAVDGLLEAMKDGTVKRHAIASLGMIGDARALPAILEVLKGRGIRQEGKPTPGCIISEEQLIKEAATTALGHFRDPRVIPDLILLLKDIVYRDQAAASLVLIGDTAIEPLIAFLHDPGASSVEKESERILAFASTRLSAAGALRKIVYETLERLGWDVTPEEGLEADETEYTSTDKVLGEEGRFGPAGDFAQGLKGQRIER